MLNAEVRSHARIVEDKFEYYRWNSEIPYFSFPSDWKVKPVPPTMNAIVRFWVKNGEDRLSVYLDCYDQLGSFGEPYWEVYPVKYSDYEDTARFAMHDTDGLIACIQSQLDGKVWV